MTEISSSSGPERSVRGGATPSRRRGALARLTFAGSVVLLGAAGYALGSGSVAPREREVTVLARQYAYDPAVIRVNKGDTLRLRFASLDVVHGFYLEGHDLDVTIVPMESAVEVRRAGDDDVVETVEEVVIEAEREGKFRYRCSHTCGFLHPFMLGELIVEPNRLLPTSLGLTLGMLVGGLLFVVLRDEEEE